jgi:fibronectin-binding autotransporter adhesin
MRGAKARVIITSLFIGLSSLLAVMLPEGAHALGLYTCTWTGGGGDSNFSTAANWSGCNSAAPQPADGDNLVFNVTALTGRTTLSNDITGLTVGSITFQGTNPSYYGFIITGNATTFGSGIVNSSNTSQTINLDMTLSSNQAITGTGSIILGASGTTHTLDLNGKTLTVGNGSNASNVSIYNILTGTGTAAVQSGSTLYLRGSNSGATVGVTAATGATVGAFTATALGSSSSTTTISNGATLDFCGLNGATISSNITVGGSGLEGFAALVAAVSCGSGGAGGSTSPAKVTLAGTITLTANTTVYTVDTMTITGPLTGNYTITGASGMSGTLVINSSHNTSQTPNGDIVASAQTINYTDNNASAPIDIGRNITGIVDGTYGATTVEDGGILKGTGTVGNLVAFGGSIVAPGHSPGCLTVNGSLQLGGTYQAEIGGTTACSDHDQLVVSGAVSLEDGVGSQATLATSLYGGFKPSAGQSYTIINNTGSGAVVNTFTGLPEGATFTVDGYVFRITYKGGDGNDVVLTVMSVPSVPNTGLALVTGNPVWPIVVTLLAVGALQVSRKALARR